MNAVHLQMLSNWVNFTRVCIQIWNGLSKSLRIFCLTPNSRNSCTQQKVLGHVNFSMTSLSWGYDAKQLLLVCLSHHRQPSCFYCYCGLILLRLCHDAYCHSHQCVGKNCHEINVKNPKIEQKLLLIVGYVLFSGFYS